MSPITALLYGATRAGKTRMLMTMRKRGRVILADFDGQVRAEAPDAYEAVLPPLPGPEATPDEQEARQVQVRAIMAEAAKADVVIWPCSSLRNMHVLNAAIQMDRLGPLTGATYGCDGLTFMNDALIQDICGVTITRTAQGGGSVDVSDAVMQSLPDFSGAGVHRAMEQQDWGRFANKVNDVIWGTMQLCRAKGMSFVATALEEKREIWSGVGAARRFVKLQQGPTLRGSVSAADVPPKFMFYLRLASRLDEQATPPVMKYAAFTVPLDGWPAGVRGKAAQILPHVIQNPDLADIAAAAGL